MDFKTISLLTAVLLAATTISSVSNNNEFSEFKGKFGKSYEASEEVVRMAVYNQNVAKIAAHNADSTQSYKMGINQFTDLTTEEFESKVLMTSWTADVEGVNMETVQVGDVNWVTAGAVSAVKDQGRCGSCWAFAAIATCESFKFLQTGTLGLFSDQMVVDCTSFPQMGCNGGRMDWALNWISNNGFCTQESYPYESGVTEKKGSCRKSACTMDSFTIAGHNAVKGTSALAAAVQIQPVSVSVDASNWSPYASGIFDNCRTSLNHGVLLAGTTSSYQLVKNSWGVAWGESGYIRLAPGNTCGIANDANVPK